MTAFGIEYQISDEDGPWAWCDTLPEAVHYLSQGGDGAKIEFRYVSEWKELAE